MVFGLCEYGDDVLYCFEAFEEFDFDDGGGDVVDNGYEYALDIVLYFNGVVFDVFLCVEAVFDTHRFVL